MKARRMESPEPEELNTITRLLQQFEHGEEGAFDQLISVVYDQLIIMARAQLAGKLGQTVTPTVLVNELYLRLQQHGPLGSPSRALFFGAAARGMRQILIDLARRKHAAKRGGGANHYELNECLVSIGLKDARLDALNEAMNKLSAIDEELARIVELRFLIGLGVEETAETLNCSPMTVKRRWATARAWLQRELKRD